MKASCSSTLATSSLLRSLKAEVLIDLSMIIGIQKLFLPEIAFPKPNPPQKFDLEEDKLLTKEESLKRLCLNKLLPKNLEEGL